MTIEEVQKDIVNEFSNKKDWMDIYQTLIAYGLHIGCNIDRNEENKLAGCQNNVWIEGHLNDNGNMSYSYYSDAAIIRGIMYLIFRVLDNQCPQDIIDAKLHFIDDLKLTNSVGNGRTNGIYVILDRIVDIAKENLNI